MKLHTPGLPVLLVDDEPHVTEGIETILNAGGIDHVLVCNDSRHVPEVLRTREVGVMFLDLWMPHIPGEEILQLCVREYPEIPVIVFTGANDVETAVRCVKNGAFEYLVKPVENARLLTAVKRALELRELRRDYHRVAQRLLSGKLDHPEHFAGILTGNPVMHGIFQYAETIAPSSKPVLITGESGTGKELMARALHKASRRPGELVAVNVAGLDDNMFSDTLFGHRKGAFTGAETSRGGIIERAAGGTLLLDEIGDLAIASQTKLLRLLEEREYFPLGADVPRRSTARIIVSTNVSPAQLRDRQRFRHDLYYRLHTHHIHLPSLRERRDDLPLLLSHFLEKAAASLGKPVPTAPRELITLLELHDFPGNVRELEALVFDAVSRHRSHVLSMETFKAHIKREVPHDTHAAAMGQESAITFGDALPTLNEATGLLIWEAVRRAKGNKSLAAEMLGISRTTLISRLRFRDGEGSQTGV